MSAYSELLDRYVERYNAGDLDGVMELYADDAVQGMPARSTARAVIGWSRSAGSQKLAAQKTTPSAPLRRTRSTRSRPFSSSAM